MESHSTSLGLEEHLLELLDPSTTPEKALQSFSYTCFTPETFTNGIEPITIFLAYIRFIIKRRPDGCLDSIWEEMLRKTMVYSQNVSRKKIDSFMSFFDQKLFSITRVVPAKEGPLVSIWVNDALSTHSKCPNPYTRLELFRLIRIFKKDWDHEYSDNMGNMLMDWERLCITFIHTINEIQPHRLYPKGDKDDLMFDVNDMDLIVHKLDHRGELRNTITAVSIDKGINECNEVFVHSKETIFISHCLQINRVFAVIANFNHNSNKHPTEIIKCFRIFKEIVNFAGLIGPGYSPPPGVSFEDRAKMVIALPPYRPYLIETVCELSTAIMNIKAKDVKLPLTYLRDLYVRVFGISTKTCDLPRLLLSREVKGPLLVDQKLLLFKNLDRYVKKKYKVQFDLQKDFMFDAFLGEFMKKYFPISNSDSDSSSNSSRSSDIDSDSSNNSSRSSEFSTDSDLFFDNDGNVIII